MKKLILLGLVVVLCLPVAVYAASIGGAETQGQGKFSIGRDQEFVFDKDMKDVITDEGYAYDGTLTILTGDEPFDLNLSGVVSDYKNKINIDNMSRTMIKLSYGVLDHLDIFVRLGEAKFKQKIGSSVF